MNADAAAEDYLARPGFVSERVLAAATAASMIVVRFTSAYPLALWIFQGPVVAVFLVVAIAAQVALVARPNHIPTLAVAAGLSTSYWVARAIDLALTTLADPEAWHLWTAVAVYILLAVFVHGFWLRSMRRIGFLTALHGTRVRRG